MVTQLDSRYNFVMAHTLEEARQIALELPEDQRILLLDSLMESLDHEDGANDAEIHESWKAEVERRVAEADAGVGVTVSWEEVEAPLRARLTK
jgi:putative addiction module component (TIGR02574 family)